MSDYNEFLMKRLLDEEFALEYLRQAQAESEEAGVKAFERIITAHRADERVRCLAEMKEEE